MPRLHPSQDELLDTAIEAAVGGGRLLADRFTSARTIEHKGSIDLVTDADKASEAVVLAAIRAHYPGHAILAEESGLADGGGEAARSDYRWYVDPLDGTTNYAHQVPHFSVSVAVEGPSGLLAGAVYDPIRRELFTASKGRGATLNGETLRASKATVLKESLLASGFPYDVHARPEVPLGLFGYFVKRARGMRRFGSAALDLCYVAAGRYDSYFETGLKPWDVAAGGLIVSEAGGVVTRIDGAPFLPTTAEVLASAPGLAAEMLEQCRICLTELGWVPA